MRQRLTAIPQSLILHKIRGFFVENCNKHNNKLTGINTPSRDVALAIKFNRKYVGPIHHTKQEEVCVLQGLLGGGRGEGGRPWIMQVRLVFLAQQEK